MRRLNPIERGFCEALLLVSGGAAAFTIATCQLPAPSPELLRSIASLGTGLLLAFVVEAVWATRQMRNAADYESRLGAFVGIAATGLVGIVVALLVSAHRVAGHSNLLDAVGLAWVTISIGTLGGLVVINPILVHEWAPKSELKQGQQ